MQRRSRRLHSPQSIKLDPQTTPTVCLLSPIGHTQIQFVWGVDYHPFIHPPPFNDKRMDKSLSEHDSLQPMLLLAGRIEEWYTIVADVQQMLYI